MNLVDKCIFLARVQKVIQSENIVTARAEKMDSSGVLLESKLSMGMPQASPALVTNEVITFITIPNPNNSELLPVNEQNSSLTCWLFSRNYF